MTDTAKSFQRPEGKLLQAAAKMRDVSMRELAELVGLSEARVRNVVNGYQAVGQGQRISIVGPEDTVAKLAGALGVTPEQLETVGRSDAAHALRRRLPGGPLPQWAEGDDSQVWRSVVARHEEIREWAEDPENYLPPDAVLGYFSVDALLGEVASRIERAQRAFGPYYWLTEPDVELTLLAPVQEVSDEDARLQVAALDVDPLVDQEAGESSEG